MSHKYLDSRDNSKQLVLIFDILCAILTAIAGILTFGKSGHSIASKLLLVLMLILVCAQGIFVMHSLHHNEKRWKYIRTIKVIHAVLMSAVIIAFWLFAGRQGLPSNIFWHAILAGTTAFLMMQVIGACCRGGVLTHLWPGIVVGIAAGIIWALWPLKVDYFLLVFGVLAALVSVFGKAKTENTLLRVSYFAMGITVVIGTIAALTGVKMAHMCMHLFLLIFGLVMFWAALSKITYESDNEEQSSQKHLYAKAGAVGAAATAATAATAYDYDAAQAHARRVAEEESRRAAKDRAAAEENQKEARAVVEQASAETTLELPREDVSSDKAAQEKATSVENKAKAESKAVEAASAGAIAGAAFGVAGQKEKDKGKAEQTSANAADAAKLPKSFLSGRSLRQINNGSLEELGMTAAQAKALQECFGIKTVKSLAGCRFVTWAQAIVDMAENEDEKIEK